MTNGKICVSVCAETADELIKQIQRAEDLADVIEIRFDCLDESEFDSALLRFSDLKCKKPYLATFRPKSKDAMFGCPFADNVSQEIKDKAQKGIEYRESGWHKISKLKNVEFIDFETDLLHEFLMTRFIFDGKETNFLFSSETDKKLKEKQVIVSEHFFDKNPQNLEQIYNGMSAEEEDGLKVDIVKIAAQADDITDTIPIWKLLERAKVENKQIIPIVMGEAGKWTRILGLAHGAFMTYASLDTGQETALGQVSAKDLIEVYRAIELDENTEIYGIIGGNTGYSMSPYIHNAAFKFHNLNAALVPLQVQNLDEFMRRMVKLETREVELNFKGFAVTIPHKQNIIKHLDYLDESAKAIGAINTVKIIDGKLHGYNTDAHGFIEPLLNFYGDLKSTKVAILGAGGAARACIYALKKVGADVTIFARDLEKAQNLADEFQVRLKELRTKNSELGTFDIVVNSTPLGTKGELENETPATAEQIKNVQLVYDLVYNPFVTRFLHEAKSANVPTIGGLAMLIAQAIEQQKIWTGKVAPVKEMSRAAMQKIQS